MPASTLLAPDKGQSVAPQNKHVSRRTAGVVETCLPARDPKVPAAAAAVLKLRQAVDIDASHPIRGPAAEPPGEPSPTFNHYDTTLVWGLPGGVPLMSCLPYPGECALPISRLERWGVALPDPLLVVARASAIPEPHVCLTHNHTATPPCCALARGGMTPNRAAFAGIGLKPRLSWRPPVPPYFAPGPEVTRPQ
ncbi:hypothetical protein BV898_10695 [Hypsibius exemplaris]|uniref:Uncharacterized protein n=1 Tax=Hypsibius exemplaris TaxID=2072580 RepID=A0A1W0WIV9_HYPEX|nr:hypothetical protein BV898_10695 [Hypsibius exemplaris]